MKTILWSVLLTSLLATSCQDKRNDSDIVALQPYSGFNTIWLDTLSTTIEGFYNVKVSILPSLELPQKAFIHVKSPRYRADKLIRILGKMKPDSVDYILGLTAHDISTTKRNAYGMVKEPTSKYEDWGVFGLGYMPGESCIVSTFRLTSAQAKVIDRLKKICIHELGHNMGLNHCEDKSCVMTDAAETIKTIDHVNLRLCASCKRKLGS